MDELSIRINILKKDIAELNYLSHAVKNLDHLMWEYLANEKEKELYYLIN